MEYSLIAAPGELLLAAPVNKPSRGDAYNASTIKRGRKTDKLIRLKYSELRNDLELAFPKLKLPAGFVSDRPTEGRTKMSASHPGYDINKHHNNNINYNKN